MKYVQVKMKSGRVYALRVDFEGTQTHAGVNGAAEDFRDLLNLNLPTELLAEPVRVILER